MNDLLNDYKLMKNVDNVLGLKPITLRVYITNKCNYNCSFCSFDNSTDDVLDYDLFVKILMAFQKAGGKTVQLSGGEPTVCEWGDKVGPACRFADLRWGMITNGFRIKEVIQSHYRPCDPVWIRVSLNAGTYNTYSKMYGKDIYEILSQIKWIRQKRPEIDIGTSMVIVEDNFYDIMDFAKISFNIGASYCRYVFPHGIEGYDNFYIRNHNFIENELNKVMELYDEEDKIKVVISRHGLHIKEPYKEDILRCYFMNLTPTIGPDGWLYPCCILVNKPEYRILNCAKDEIKFDTNYSSRDCPPCISNYRNKQIMEMINTQFNSGIFANHSDFI